MNFGEFASERSICRCLLKSDKCRKEKIIFYPRGPLLLDATVVEGSVSFSWIFVANSLWRMRQYAVWQRHYGIIPHNFSGFLPLLGSKKWRKRWGVFFFWGGGKADWNKTLRLGFVKSAIVDMIFHTSRIISVKASVHVVDATHVGSAGGHRFFNPQPWSCVLNCGRGTHISCSTLRNNSATAFKVLWNCLQTKLISVYPRG